MTSTGNRWGGPLTRIDEFRWMIPRNYKAGMFVPGILYADEAHIEDIREDGSPEQVANAAFLPGIAGPSLAMPDVHLGYGFAIGAVVATDAEEGVVAPGAIGFDINCGVRLLRTNLSYAEAESYIEALVERLFRTIPSGVGSSGAISLTPSEIEEVLKDGAVWAIKRGYGSREDLERTEEGGRLPSAEPEKVSDRAIKRGLTQLGTLGSGNHFVELQVVESVFDPQTAEVMGIFEGQLVVMIHTGSRGLGHQVCTDYLARMRDSAKKYEFNLPDKQLACAPIASREGKDYLAAMACAANYAWANRQCITHWVRESFLKVLRKSDIGLEVVYDVAHNIAKLEEHIIEGERKLVCVHRKGATRAFPPGHAEIPAVYRQIGQPVLVPGDMGRNSYLLVGTERAMRETFGSTCHGAGRTLSRAAAKRELSVDELLSELTKRGIIARAASKSSLIEEAPEAYKDVNEVVAVADGAGISRKVARMRPVAVIKG